MIISIGHVRFIIESLFIRYIKNVHPFITNNRGLSQSRVTSFNLLPNITQAVIYEQNHLNDMIARSGDDESVFSDFDERLSMSVRSGRSSPSKSKEGVSSMEEKLLSAMHSPNGFQDNI